MYVDLLTLYLLAIGTLLASAGMMFWEHLANLRHGKALRILSAAFATLAVGCVTVLFRRAVPGVLGSALANLVMLCGYLLILNGVAALSSRRYRITVGVVLCGMAVVWAVSGTRWLDAVWNYVSAFPIAIISAMTAREMLRCDALKPFFARHIVVAVAGIHALLYAGRAFALPWLVSAYGPAMQGIASKITMYEGVLYSVILPMTILKLIREDSHTQLLKESQTDYLTRLGNRRWFFEQGQRILAAEDHRRPVAVLAFDLDQFKAINDRYGHQAGDEVLKSFAEIARGVMGPDVLFARIGGEEFAALLYGADAQRAGTLGATVAAQFAENIAGRIAGVGIPATVSIGLAQFERETPVLSDALVAADQALYRAKALGGNRLEIAQTEERSATV